MVLFAIDVTLFTGRMLLFRCLQEKPKVSLKVDFGVKIDSCIFLCFSFPVWKIKEQISLKSLVSGISLSKLHYFFNFFFYCNFSPPFQSFQVLTKWSISFLQCCLVRKGGLLSMSSNLSISVYYVEWRVVDLLTFLLPIMPVWHIGQQRNPSNPVYL